ncbi:MAG: AraC family transcriptional regulator [Pseudomonadales bacterium]|nr:AraC family transcriptional regulator [Pseudomonadales bacterium]
MIDKFGNKQHYLPITDQSIMWDIYLTGVGSALVQPQSLYPPENHPSMYKFKWNKGRVLPEYQILFISEGKGVFESSATGTVEVKPNTMLILFPDIWHRYKPDKKTGWKKSWISFNGEYLYKLTKNKLISPQKSMIMIDDTELLLGIYQRIWSSLKIQKMQNSFLLSAYTMELLSFVVDATERSCDNDFCVNSMSSTEHILKDRVLAEAIRYIWSHSHRNISVNKVVENLPVTRRTLERKFSHELGRSIGSEIIRCRIERAKHLLANTSLPISHIALAVGFSGSDRLCKVFNKLSGMTPGQYRAMIKY